MFASTTEGTCLPDKGPNTSKGKSEKLPLLLLSVADVEQQRYEAADGDAALGTEVAIRADKICRSA